MQKISQARARAEKNLFCGSQKHGLYGERSFCNTLNVDEEMLLLRSLRKMILVNHQTLKSL